MQRTALESALIPVTAYILIACVECYRRYPEMIERDRRRRAARGARARGSRARRPRSTRCTCGRSRTSRWSAARCSRQPAWSTASRTCADMATVFDFWERAARAYRFDDGTHQAWDADGVATPYRAHVDDIVDGVPAVAGRRRARADGAPQRAAHVVPVPALVRHPLRLPGHRSVPSRRRADVAAPRRSTGSASRTSRGAREVVDRAAVPRRARRVRARRRRPARHRLRHVGDRPEDYLPHVVEFGCSTSPTGRRRRSTTTVSPRRGRREAGADARSTARSRAMERNEKIDAGRVRVLHVPAPVRRARRRRARLDRAARQPRPVPVPR